MAINDCNSFRSGFIGVRFQGIVTKQFDLSQLLHNLKSKV